MKYLPWIAGGAALGLAARRGRRAAGGGVSYFSASWIANAEEEARAYKTKELFAYMPPEEFLALAEPFSREGESPSKRENVLRLLTENTRFRDGPALSFDETGQVYGHEGRHRATALLRMGVARIPVLLRARGGTGIRWGEQDDPTAWGYNKNLPSWLLSEKPGNRPPHERAAWRQKRVAPWYTRGPERGQLRPEYRVPSTGRAARRATGKGQRAEAYPWLSLAKIKKYEQLMRDRGVSEVARSPRGFLTAYKRAGSKTRLDPEWRMKRDGFVARHWTQAQKQARPLYETKGKYAGTPARWHLALIAWGFSPDGAKAL